jgi:putative transposase
MEKVAPSARFRAELDEALAGVAGERDPIETVGRLGARLILQQALEDEITEFLGRDRYERTGEPVSHRNGYESRTVKTTSGPVRLERPRVRDARKLGFESKVLGKGVWQGRGAHPRVGVAGDQRLFARTVHAGHRGRPGGGLRGAGRFQEHRLQGLRGHPRAAGSCGRTRWSSVARSTRCAT